ncbi:MAG: 3-deoxy-manno-octulosonate cytidylyltransferase [Planctomycetes bacterium]|nr:3-deoxy-manno-octulosonate cytidylyltransferase [Planctomycetota bacterium]
MPSAVHSGSGPRAVAIIPARLGSTRFPGKVLANKTGKPLIQHVCEAAARTPVLSRIVIATDDRTVMDAVKGFGGEAVLTRTDHPNGTSRLAEAAAILGLRADDIVVNVQGDEPEIEPSLIEAAVGVLGDSPVATVASPMSDADANNPNIVKVVVRQDGRAMYFSRSRVPYVRDAANAESGKPLRHVGLYVYRRSFLDRYLTLEPTPLERAESLEQLRILEHGYSIAVALMPAEVGHAGIDTPEQYEAFVKRAIGKR